jgi:hypothetical protein
LVVEFQTGFVERYKRFYFRDIEGFILRKTAHWLAGIGIWSAVALIFTFIALATHWNLFLEIMVAVCAGFAIRHALGGPSCRTHIQTAVQTDKIPMLKRVRKTHAVLQRLMPLIEQAQAQVVEAAAPKGATPPLPSEPHQASTAAVAGVTAEEPTATEAAVAPRVERPPLSFVHLVTFILVLCTGLLAVWEVAAPVSQKFVALLIFYGLSVIGGITSVYRQARRAVHRGAAVLAWVLVVGYVMGGVWINIGFSLIDQMQQVRVHQATKSPSVAPAFHEITPFRMRHMPWFDHVLWAMAIGSILLALLGLIFVFRPARPRAVPPPLPKDPM